MIHFAPHSFLVLSSCHISNGKPIERKGKKDEKKKMNEEGETQTHFLFFLFHVTSSSALLPFLAFRALCITSEEENGRQERKGG